MLFCCGRTDNGILLVKICANTKDNTNEMANAARVVRVTIRFQNYALLYSMCLIGVFLLIAFVFVLNIKIDIPEQVYPQHR